MKTSTEAYTQGNVTVTGGAGTGNTRVNISVPKPMPKTMKVSVSKKMKCPDTHTMPDGTVMTGKKHTDRSVVAVPMKGCRKLSK